MLLHMIHRLRDRTGIVLLTLGITLGLAVAVQSVAATADVRPFVAPLPTAAGPITGPPGSVPFMHSRLDLASFGYIEEEFFVSGTANVYWWTAGGIRLNPEAAKNNPYTTRIIVRRPVDPVKYSGNVIVEWLNPSGLFDAALMWGFSHEYFMRKGDIFVGLTIKSVTVTTMQAFYDPVKAPGRYTGINGLNWPRGTTCNGPLMDNCAYDGMAWDIGAQVGRLLKENPPFPSGFHVNRIYATGWSQTGMYLINYVNGFHKLERMPSPKGTPGGPIYDGYVIGAALAPVPIDLAGGYTAQPPFPHGLSKADRRWFVQDLPDAKIIHFNTETEVYLAALEGALILRRSDSARFRLYEVAGAAHLDITAFQFGDGGVDMLGTDFPVATTFGCLEENQAGVVFPTDFPVGYVLSAAFENLDRWIQSGEVPPKAQRIKVSLSPSAAVKNDKYGNAVGGVRTPYVDVPIADYNPTCTASSAESFFMCMLFGNKVPFTDVQLKTLYKGHDDYVQKVADQTDKLVKNRWLLQAEADKIKSEAAQADVP
jgi:hypothetical protein